MTTESAYEKLYNELIENLEEMHHSNVRRTSAALKSLLIIPTIFLILLFLTDSNKTVFLVLWIVSMFIIACVLIVIEYQDYKLQQMFKKTSDNEHELKSSIENQDDEQSNERVEEIRRSIRNRLPESEKPSETEEKTEATVG